jgi:hypothetical protein
MMKAFLFIFRGNTGVSASNAAITSLQTALILSFSICGSTNAIAMPKSTTALFVRRTLGRYVMQRLVRVLDPAFVLSA